ALLLEVGARALARRRELDDAEHVVRLDQPPGRGQVHGRVTTVVADVDGDLAAVDAAGRVLRGDARLGAGGTRLEESGISRVAGDPVDEPDLHAARAGARAAR